VSAVNESIVREYFESLGYLVRQPHKYLGPGRQKETGEDVDMVVFNPRVREHKPPASLVLKTADLKTVARAVISIHGWHTDRLYTSTLEQAPELIRFAAPDAVRFAARILGTTTFAKILCIPRLPASGELKDKTVKALKAKGIDGIITFRTMLAELVNTVDTNRNYEKSDLLQAIRLLKNYDLLKDSQLELFGKKRRRSKAKQEADGKE